jgi:prevent-host-death family protein
MGKLLDIIPVSDLRQGAARVLKQVKDSREPIVITQRGRAAAVMLSIEAYEQSERDRELLHLLAKGEKEIEAGSGHDLDSVLAEADALLAEEPS